MSQALKPYLFVNQTTLFFGFELKSGPNCCVSIFTIHVKNILKKYSNHSYWAFDLCQGWVIPNLCAVSPKTCNPISLWPTHFFKCCVFVDVKFFAVSHNGEEESKSFWTQIWNLDPCPKMNHPSPWLEPVFNEKCHANLSIRSRANNQSEIHSTWMQADLF